jgi:hypothetical protein
MDFDFLGRVRKASIITGIFLTPVLMTYLGISFGAAWIAGITWSLINLHFISGLMKNILTKRKRNNARIALLMAAKFPLLYSVGYLLLKSSVFSVLGLVAGFVWPFLVISMKALGRAFAHFDEIGSIGLEENADVSLKIKS